jgi:hypothetical protein
LKVAAESVIGMTNFLGSYLGVWFFCFSMKLLFQFLFILLILAKAQAASSADEQARFLAGLNVDGCGLEPLAREQAWQDHAAEFHRAWSDLEERQLSQIRTWMPSSCAYIYSDPSPLFYMFSGPDFLYANAFYASASTYILCGREPVGMIPDVTMLSSEARSAALKNMRTALTAILSFSFFITADMKTDLTQTQLSGTLPVLYVFLSRMGCRIEEVKLVGLTASGELTQEKSKTPGVRITFHGTTGNTQTLYYFTTDLSNWGIKANPGFMQFCDKQGVGNGFAKAASYLMHSNEFSTVRDFLLNKTRHMVQDDSGIPFQFFKESDWMMSLYGHYAGPIDLFKQHEQADLRAAFAVEKSGDLPFGVGYQWRPGVSSLMISTSMRQVPKAEAVAEPVRE